MRILIAHPSRCGYTATMILALMCTTAASIAAAPAQTAVSADPKLRQAEAAANRIVERFHRTLRFDDMFAEEFVSDDQLKARALSLDDEEKWKQFDLPTRERLYVAMMTFLHLWADYQLIQKEHDLPPEFEKHPEPKLFSHSPPPQNLVELNQDILELDQMSVVYRKYFPPGVFESARYRENIKPSAEYIKTLPRTVPRIEKGNAKFGIPETVSVYIVRPEAFDYYFIEEKGMMKLFYVNIMPDLNLF
jgi:hypothetical protein